MALVTDGLADRYSGALWKRDDGPPIADEEVSEDFRGRVYPGELETDSVDVVVETDEDFRGRVRVGETSPVASR